jgi:exonuclease III
MIKLALLFIYLFSLISPSKERVAPFSFKEEWSGVVFQVASALTDPICASHSSFKQISIANGWIEKIFLTYKALSNSLTAIVTAPAGILLRATAIAVQNEPYLYFPGNALEKSPGRSFSLLSWNVCFVGGGYSITNGGVSPWSQRIDGVVEAIRAQDADVVCLYETFDTRSAFELHNRLKDQYAHFYFNIGPKAVGVSSGIFVASKFPIENPQFTPFTDAALVGRTKNAEKGVFSFDLKDGESSFARIHATHMQHSEECDSPTPEEIEARDLEMEIILKQIEQQYDHHLITLLAGDWNLDDVEYENSSWKNHFDRGERHFNGEYTWGGDQFCATLEKKSVSKPLNLDHTALHKQSSSATLETYLVETGYDATVYTESALSDHRGLYSIVTLQ